MKLVIDISEQDYWLACNHPEALIDVYAQCIKKGRPLPEKLHVEVNQIEDVMPSEFDIDKLTLKIQLDIDKLIALGWNACLDKIKGEKTMIKNPAFPGDPVYDMAFNLYAMEEEGLLPTHQGCLNKLCNLLKERFIDADDYDSFQCACNDAGIDWELNYEDWEYIKDRLG